MKEVSFLLDIFVGAHLIHIHICIYPGRRAGERRLHSARARMGCYSNVLMEGRGRQGARRDGVWAVSRRSCIFK